MHMQKSLGDRVQRALAGFAAGVMVAACLEFADSRHRTIGKDGEILISSGICRALGGRNVFAGA